MSVTMTSSWVSSSLNWVPSPLYPSMLSAQIWYALRFADPVIRGDYPRVMRRILKDRLPVFTPLQKRQLKGSMDFVGLNCYTALYASAPKGNETADDTGALFSCENEWMNVRMNVRMNGLIACFHECVCCKCMLWTNVVIVLQISRIDFICFLSRDGIH